MIDDKIETYDALFSAAGCACFHNNEILLLKRNNDKSFPNNWGVPTGKLYENETAIHAIIRELYEETKIVVSSELLKLVDTFLINNDEMSFRYIMYFVNFENIPTVNINFQEHSEFIWIHIDQLDSLKLVPNAKETILLAVKKRNLRPFTQLNLFTNEPDTLPPINIKLNKYLSEFSGLTKRFEIQKKWVVSFGPPGSGKTTLLKKLQKKIPNSFLISENKQILTKGTRLNHYLTEATENKKYLYYFYFQIEFLTERFKQSFNAPDNSFVDESIYSVLAYSIALYRLGWLTKYEFETFLSNYQFYFNFLPYPTKILYLNCSSNTMLDRIEKRLINAKNRQHEKNYKNKYLEALENGFKEVAEQMKNAGYEIVFIDTDGKSVDVITNEVLKRIGQIWN